MATSSNSQATVLARLDLIREDVCHLKADIKNVSEKLTGLERTYAGDHATMVEQQKNVLARVSRLESWQENEVEPFQVEVRKVVGELKTQARIVTFFGSTLALAVISFLFAVATQQLQVVVP